jgi:hypothetical protein
VVVVARRVVHYHRGDGQWWLILAPDFAAAACCEPGPRVWHALAVLLPLLLAALVGCEAPPASPPTGQVAAPGEAWFDGGPIAVPPLRALLRISDADEDGLRGYVVYMGEEQTCAGRLEYDLAVDDAFEKFPDDEDDDALDAALDAATYALYPAGTWRLRLDLGRRATSSDDLPLDDISLFAERRTEESFDIVFTAGSPDTTAFTGGDGHAAGEMEFGANWLGPAGDQEHHEFQIGFNAGVCE